MRTRNYLRERCVLLLLTGDRKRRVRILEAIAGLDRGRDRASAPPCSEPPMLVIGPKSKSMTVTSTAPLPAIAAIDLFVANLSAWVPPLRRALHDCSEEGTRASRGSSRSVSTHTTAPACSATERTNAATTVHLLGGLYTAAGGTTCRRRVRFAAGGRHIRITRAFGATSEVFNVAVCI
jgi:hypothetical protein